MAAIEILGHGPLLGALAADQEGHLARPASGHGDQGGWGCLRRHGVRRRWGTAPGKGLQLAFQIGPIAGQADQALLEGGALLVSAGAKIA